MSSSSLSVGVASDFPDQVAASLIRANKAKQTCTDINARGTLVAVGGSDGVVAIYDLETRAVAKLLKGHTKPVIAVCWSLNSHHLLSASTDGLVIRWNVLEGSWGSYATLNQWPPPPIPANNNGNESSSVLSNQRRIRSIKLHPTITDLALINFYDHDYPLLLELDPLPPTIAASSPLSSANPSSSPVPPSSSTPSSTSPSPFSAPASSLLVDSIGVALNNSAAAEVPPRNPRWARHVTRPFVESENAVDESNGKTARNSKSARSAAATASSATIAPPPATPAAFTSAPPVPYTRWNSSCATFDRRYGRFIFEGNSKGTIFVYLIQYDREKHRKYRRDVIARANSRIPSHEPDAHQQNGCDAMDTSSDDHPQSAPSSSFLTITDPHSLPPYLSLHLLHVEAPPAQRGRRTFSSVIIQLVQSFCGQYLLANFSHQLKLYRLDSNIFMSPDRLTDEDLINKYALTLPQREKELSDILGNGARVVAPAKWTKKQREAAAAAAAAAAAKKKQEEQEEEEGQTEHNESSATRGDEAMADAENTPNNNNSGETAVDSSPSPTPTASKQSKAQQATEEDEDEEEAQEEELAPVMEYMCLFSDHVNRVPWRTCTFLPSSDFVLGGSSERGEHRIHIWSIHSGQLSKILLGPTEGLLDLSTHPSMPVLLTACTSGCVHVWTKNYVENWSAFAPDFEELDDNEEYVEREDEFDILPLDALKGMTSAVECVDIATRHEPIPTNTDDELITLPTTVMKDPEAAAAYEARRTMWRESEESRVKQHEEKEKQQQQQPSMHDQAKVETSKDDEEEQKEQMHIVNGSASSPTSADAVILPSAASKRALNDDEDEASNKKART